MLACGVLIGGRQRGQLLSQVRQGAGCGEHVSVLGWVSLGPGQSARPLPCTGPRGVTISVRTVTESSCSKMNSLSVDWSMWFTGSPHSRGGWGGSSVTRGVGQLQGLWSRSIDCSHQRSARPRGPVSTSTAAQRARQSPRLAGQCVVAAGLGYSRGGSGRARRRHLSRRRSWTREVGVTWVRPPRYSVRRRGLVSRVPGGKHGASMRGAVVAFRAAGWRAPLDTAAMSSERTRTSRRSPPSS